MARFAARKWLLAPLGILLFLGTALWLIGRIQYRLGVMDVEEYDPVSSLKVPEHRLTRARYPFVDVHNHQWLMPVQDLDKLVTEMDALNMAVMVNLSGFRGKLLEWSLANVQKHQSRRFLVFVNLDFEKLDEPEWPGLALAQLDEAVKHGAVGLKVYKSLGLTDHDKRGQRIAVDDPRLDAIWARCGELAIPVLIHSGSRRRSGYPRINTTSAGWSSNKSPAATVRQVSSRRSRPSSPSSITCFANIPRRASSMRTWAG